MKVTCKECRFWKELLGHNDTGECRRHPPMMREGAPRGEWLQTWGASWCGEGAARVKVGAGPVAPTASVDDAGLGGCCWTDTGPDDHVRRDLAMERDRRRELDGIVERLTKRVEELEECCKAHDATEHRLRMELAALADSIRLTDVMNAEAPKKAKSPKRT